MGDSLTLGVGDGFHDSDGSQGWAAHAAKALGASRFHNVARNGVRARHLDQHVAVALDDEADIVLMSVGGNDVLRSDFDPAEIRRAVRSAIVRLQTAGCRVVLLTLTPIRLFTLFPSAIISIMTRRIDAANEALADAVAGTKARVVDIPTVMSLGGDEAWHTDRIHPSPKGHRLIAGRALHVIEDFPIVAEIEDAPPPPSRVIRTWWIVRKGIPWIAKRSVDLIPGIAWLLISELRRTRRERARAPRTRDRPPVQGSFAEREASGRV
jgi:lysophospholipase L1-like esterase